VILTIDRSHLRPIFPRPRFSAHKGSDECCSCRGTGRSRGRILRIRCADGRKAGFTSNGYGSTALPRRSRLRLRGHGGTGRCSSGCWRVSDCDESLAEDLAAGCRIRRREGEGLFRRLRKKIKVTAIFSDQRCGDFPQPADLTLLISVSLKPNHATRLRINSRGGAEIAEGEGKKGTGFIIRVKRGQASRWDAVEDWRFPGDESPGYFRVVPSGLGGPDGEGRRS